MGIFSGPIWILAAIVGLIFVLTVIANPFVGVLALFGLGMVSDLQHFGHFASFSKLLVPLVAIGFLGRLVVKRQHLRDHLVLPLALFVVIYCVGLSRGIKGPEGWIGPATFAGYVVGFFLVLNVVKTKKQIGWILGVTAACAAFDSFELIAQWFHVSTPLSFLRRPGLPMAAFQASAHVDRTLGFARDPNAAAYPCILAAPVLLAFAFTAKRLSSRLAALALFGVTVLGLATTQSRSGWLGLGVGVATLLFFLGKRSFRIVPVLIILFCVALAFLPYRKFEGRFGSTEHEFDSDRAVQYETGLALLARHPVMGVRTEVFEADMAEKIGGPFQPHSNLLSVAVNSGLLGLAALAFLVFNYLSVFSRMWVRIKDTELKLYAAGAFSAVVGLQAQGLFIGNMGWFLMWSTGALCLCSLMAEQKEAARVAPPHRVQTLRRRPSWQSEASVSLKALQ